MLAGQLEARSPEDLTYSVLLEVMTSSRVRGRSRERNSSNEQYKDLSGSKLDLKFADELQLRKALRDLVADPYGGQSPSVDGNTRTLSWIALAYDPVAVTTLNIIATGTYVHALVYMHTYVYTRMHTHTGTGSNVFMSYGKEHSKEQRRQQEARDAAPDTPPAQYRKHLRPKYDFSVLAIYTQEMHAGLFICLATVLI